MVIQALRVFLKNKREGYPLLEAVISGLYQTITWPSVGFLLLGAIIGLVVGVIPGLGGIFALSVLLPFAYKMDLSSGLAFLLAAHAVINTSGAITAILFGTPGSPGTAATVFDGYPMNRKGQAGIALGANLTASGLGGLFGAIILALLIPVVRPIILAFGSPEYFLIALLGISMISVMSDGSSVKALVAGAFGLMLSTIGMEPSYGATRFTFGQLYLWDGLPLVPVVIGLFAYAEMMELIGQGALSISETKQDFKDMKQGVKEVFVRWWLVVRCSLIGIFVGLIPGLGSETANFIAYGHARQTSKSPETFGYGNVEGVIGPDSANNSKEGGTLLPTLAFGIPGSAAMALILGAFMIWGIQPGPSMVKENLPITFLMVWTVAIGNIVGALMCFPLSSWTIKLTNIRSSIMVPVIVAFATVGAFATNNTFGDIVVAGVFGLIGYWMKKFGYSRAILLIGLVLGGIAERNLNLTLNLYSLDFIFRPISMTIILMIIAIWLWPLVQKSFKGRTLGK